MEDRNYIHHEGDALVGESVRVRADEQSCG